MQKTTNITLENNNDLDLISKNLFKNCYLGKKVLITGHTGFKGAWLCKFLQGLGATVVGVSKDFPSSPCHFELLYGKSTEVKFIDINDTETLSKIMVAFKPDIVFHLAAQALVRCSHKNPLQTYKDNLLGTLSVYQSILDVDSVRAVVSITTDKVYENRGWHWGYRETDTLGGKDPYSASKACVEIMSKSFIESYWPKSNYGKDHGVLLSTVRAGNVIGGGDWAEDRLLPDVVKSYFNGKPVIIRSPKSTRPWQHVLDPISGYLQVGQKLLEGSTEHACPYNFGPQKCATVESVIKEVLRHWKNLEYEICEDSRTIESKSLSLNYEKAQAELSWKPLWDMPTSIRKTTEWYSSLYKYDEVISVQQIKEYAENLQ